MTQAEKLTLTQKLCKASQQVGGALKADKRNRDQDYAYISADKIMTVCGQALADNGIVIYPAIVKQEIEATERGAGKSPRLDCTVDFMFIVSDGETPLEFTWFGRGSDYSVPDKAMYKAITSGHKYFLMKLLNVGEGNEDSEHEKPTAPPRPAEEILPELGFDIEYPPELAVVANSNGEPYVNLPSDKLKHMRRAMGKKLDEPNALPPDQRAQYEKKCAAIDEILRLRGE